MKRDVFLKILIGSIIGSMVGCTVFEKKESAKRIIKIHGESDTNTYVPHDIIMQHIQCELKEK